MMKRPRSFISTLIVLLSLATVPLGLTVNAHDAHAGGLPRVMDPRAGDPTQPDDSQIPSDSSIEGGGDDLTVVTPQRFYRPTANLYLSQGLGTTVSMWFISWLAARGGPN
jgi:hypothetical protein